MQFLFTTVDFTVQTTVAMTKEQSDKLELGQLVAITGNVVEINRENGWVKIRTHGVEYETLWIAAIEQLELH